MLWTRFFLEGFLKSVRSWSLVQPFVLFFCYRSMCMFVFSNVIWFICPTGSMWICCVVKNININIILIYEVHFLSCFVFAVTTFRHIAIKFPILRSKKTPNVVFVLTDSVHSVIPHLNGRLFEPLVDFYV